MTPDGQYYCKECSARYMPDFSKPGTLTPIGPPQSPEAPPSTPQPPESLPLPPQSPESPPQSPEAQLTPSLQQEWLLKGWALGWAYYNIYFDNAGMHAVRLDLVGTRVVTFGGWFQKAYTKDLRVHAQNKALGKSYGQMLMDNYKVDIEAPYDQIISIKCKGMFKKKLIFKIASGTGKTRKQKFFQAYASEDPRPILKQIPYLEGKLLFK